MTKCGGLQTVCFRLEISGTGRLFSDQRAQAGRLLRELSLFVASIVVLVRHETVVSCCVAKCFHLCPLASYGTARLYKTLRPYWRA